MIVDRESYELNECNNDNQDFLTLVPSLAAFLVTAQTLSLSLDI